MTHYPEHFKEEVVAFARATSQKDAKDRLFRFSYILDFCYTWLLDLCCFGVICIAQFNLNQFKMPQQ